MYTSTVYIVVVRIFIENNKSTNGIEPTGCILTHHTNCTLLCTCYIIFISNKYSLVMQPSPQLQMIRIYWSTSYWCYRKCTGILHMTTYTPHTWIYAITQAPHTRICIHKCIHIHVTHTYACTRTHTHACAKTTTHISTNTKYGSCMQPFYKDSIVYASKPEAHCNSSQSSRAVCTSCKSEAPPPASYQVTSSDGKFNTQEPILWLSLMAG